MTSLESQAEERKARLAALRNKNKQPTGAQTTTSTLPPLKSRNFDQEQRISVQGLSQPPTALDENSETVEAVSQAIQEQVLMQFRARADVDHVETPIKPRKITWDLERDMKEDLDLLEEKTDEVIKALVKERLRKLQAVQPQGEEEE